MTNVNPHVGSTFESWLDEKGIREGVTAAAVKRVIADQIAAAMKERGLTKTRMAELMHTSRAQLDRLLDPSNGSVTLETLMTAARAVGRELCLSLFERSPTPRGMAAGPECGRVNSRRRPIKTD